MRKTEKYSILIICEGSNTEPNYFKGIKEEIITNEVWTEGVSIEIRPTPKLEEDDDAPYQSKHKTKRKKRQLRKVNQDDDLEDIEEIYKAVPTRYIREAQKGLEDGTFNEAWAIFDKDYHPRHKEAFNLAKNKVNEKEVQIAFSSISFEHWILLHFEKNITAFNKSECKNAKKKVINCGLKLGNKLDCKGSRCISGYLKFKKYLPNYSKKSQIDLYSLLKDKTKTAISNTSWLRSKISGTPIFDLNPYCTVDILVKHLLKIEEENIWSTITTPQIINGFKISVRKLDKVAILVSVENLKDISQIFRSTLSFYRNEKLVRADITRSLLINPKETKLITITSLHSFLPYQQVKFVINKKYNLFFDLL